MKPLTLIAALAIAVSSPVAAKDTPEFRQVRAKENVTFRPDRAYLLMRVRKPLSRAFNESGPEWLRPPTASEMAAYETARKGRAPQQGDFPLPDGFSFHFYSFDLDRATVRDANGWTVLVEAIPGTYALTGVAWHGFSTSCFCLGSVRFEAKPGVLTDLGTFLVERAADPSPEPELAPVSNLGAIAKMDYYLPAGAIRPATATDPIPTQAGGAPRVLADYHAFAPFVLGGAQFSIFLAPMPGVLEYRRGGVFDVKADQILQPR
jgi:hypothetical protein